MALFNCSECGYEFSDQAEGCPQCGCPNTPGGMTPIGPPPEPGGKSGRGKLSKTQKIALTVVLSTMFVPVMFLAPIFCIAASNNLAWQLSYSLPTPLTQLIVWGFALLGFSVPCGFFAWILSRIWIR